MTSKRWSLIASSAAALTLVALSISALQVSAQVSGRKTRDAQPGGKDRPAHEVTLVGRIVDVHCAMTGKYPSEDQVKCTTDCIRSGVPAALETATGLVVLGQGMTGPTKTLAPLAFQEVEIRGTLYEKGGLRYLDISSIQKAEDEEEYEEYEGEDQP